jgi:hypothetical protein
LRIAVGCVSHVSDRCFRGTEDIKSAPFRCKLFLMFCACSLPKLVSFPRGRAECFFCSVWGPWVSFRQRQFGSRPPKTHDRQSETAEVPRREPAAHTNCRDGTAF